MANGPRKKERSQSSLLWFGLREVKILFLAAEGAMGERKDIGKLLGSDRTDGKWPEQQDGTHSLQKCVLPLGV